MDIVAYHVVFEKGLNFSNILQKAFRKRQLLNNWNQAIVNKIVKQPLACAVLGYDSVKLLTDAITRAGSVDTQKVAEALAATKNFKAVTGPMSLDKNHDAVKSVVIIEYKDGRQVYKTTLEP